MKIYTEVDDRELLVGGVVEMTQTGAHVVSTLHSSHDDTELYPDYTGPAEFSPEVGGWTGPALRGIVNQQQVRVAGSTCTVLLPNRPRRGVVSNCTLEVQTRAVWTDPGTVNERPRAKLQVLHLDGSVDESAWVVQAAPATWNEYISTRYTITIVPSTPLALLESDTILLVLQGELTSGGGDAETHMISSFYNIAVVFTSTADNPLVF